MELLLSGLAAALFVAASHNAIRVVPAAFYALAAGLDALYAVGLCFGLPSFAWSVVLFAVQRCQLAVMLFAIVMFAGALSKNSSLRRAIAPIRGELSLVATILAASHVGYHVSMWVQQAGVTGALPATRMAAFAVAAVLTVLLAVLALTSVKAVRLRMDPALWKMVQRLAYVFFGLTYVHILLIFLPSLAAGTQAVWQRFALYTGLFAVYAACRVARALLDRGAPEERAV